MIDYTGVLISALFLNFATAVYRCGWFKNVHIRLRAAAKSRIGHSKEILPGLGNQSEKDELTDSKHGSQDIRSRRTSTIDYDDHTDNSSVGGSSTDASVERMEFSSKTCEENPHNRVACLGVKRETEMARRHRILLYVTYLPVYLLAASADWLQGPYKYAVYSAYGYDQRAIAFLFVAGFGSGMTVGAIIGGFADSWGRKRMACAYCCVYALSCLAKHVRHFGVLLCGRVLGGIAASLLFSVFDAWLIKAHDARNIDESFLAQSFSAANYGSSFVAIVAGLLANALVGRESDHPLRPVFAKENSTWNTDQLNVTRAHADDAIWDEAILYRGGGIRAFDLALVPLALCLVLAVVTWEENYGDKVLPRRTGKGNKGNMCSSLRGAMWAVWNSSDIFNLCAVCSFFEGAMYVFIFQWTPALRALDTNPPLGTVFATFMVCCMFGTSAFSIAVSYKVPPQKALVYLLLLSTASCVVISLSDSAKFSYAAMLLYEGCIGAYWPAISTVKARTVPEGQRAAIYNVFRFPMNFIVLVNLLTNLTFKRSFGLCGIMLAVSTVFMSQITSSRFGDERPTISKVKELDATPLLEENVSDGIEERYCRTFFDWRRRYYVAG
mmetsp:Transcript_35694/g.106520  ORF Transcript_35694/g.106520 Transcript_35694/m.106520 type:complete len:610 (-) Transcript_35694:907-2736(-)